MAEIIGAGVIGLLFQGALFKLFRARGISGHKAVLFSGVIFFVLYSALGTFGFSDGESFGLAEAVSLALPATLLVSALLSIGVRRGAVQEDKSVPK